MLELPHILVGAAIATAIPNPLISVPLALTSHFIGDYVPHWNPHFSAELKKYGRLKPKTFLILTLDAGLAIFIGFYIGFLTIPDFPGNLQSVYLIACCLASVLPDVVEIPYYFFGIKNKFLVRLTRYQKKHQFNVPFLPGLLSQILVMFFSLLVIFR